jgi:hypothetical protein
MWFDRVRFVVAVVCGVLLVSGTLVFAASASGSTALTYTTPTGESGVLSQATVPPDATVVLAANDPGIVQVSFYVDDPAGASDPAHIAMASPFEFGLTPMSLEVGVHSVVAAISLANGQVSDVFARFDVAPMPAPSPTSVAPTTAAPTTTSTTVVELPATQKPKVFAGGADVAVVWEAPAVTPASYKVYRDGAVVGETTKTGESQFLHDDGTRYYDADIVAGQTYSYAVSYVDAAGVESALSEPTDVLVPVQSPATPVVTVDSSVAPELEPYLLAGKAEIERWYPKMAMTLAHPEYVPRNDILLSLENESPAIAYASNGRIVLDTEFARGNQDDLGVFVHEATHILQSYTQQVPGWIVEGIADWTREHMYVDRPPSVTPPGDWDKGYGQSSTFLEWIRTTYEAPDFIKTLNVAANAGTYSDELFVTATGKTIAQLGAEFDARA